MAFSAQWYNPKVDLVTGLGCRAVPALFEPVLEGGGWGWFVCEQCSFTWTQAGKMDEDLKLGCSCSFPGSTQWAGVRLGERSCGTNVHIRQSCFSA